jgi:peptide/nickel transport system ATP-binding protein
LPASISAKGPVILEARKVDRHYRDQVAVNGVSFMLRRGQALGIIGESGSGKSTLARTLLALEAAQGGAVCLEGEPFSPDLKPDTLRPLRQKIQAVFQDPSASFNPLWPIRRIVAEPLHLLPERPTAVEIETRVSEALGAVGLSPDITNRLPHQFSGGQKQKIAIARALVLKPDILVLDEAVSALDTVSREQVLDLLNTLKKRDGLSLVFVSHDLSAVRSLVDHILIMKDAEAVEYGETARIFTAPQAPYTRALLAASPVL